MKAACLVLALTVALRGDVSAQLPVVPRSQGPRHDVASFAGNIAISGVLAGLVRAASGDSFWRAFLKGCAGGAVSFGAKELATSDLPGAGLLGREMNSVGASVVRAATLGGGMLDTLILPLGPVRLYVSTRDSGVRARLDVDAVAWATYAMLTPRFSFDLDRSLSAGALVFTSSEPLFYSGDDADGRVGGGTVFLDKIHAEEVLPHELVHVAQIDFLKIVVGLPLEDLAVRRLGLAQLPVLSWLDLGIGHYPIQVLAHSLMEEEAHGLVP